jgi:xanthine dehydrogenase accessory factor
MIRGELARHAEQLVAERVPFVHATVVRARRPTSVRPGDAAIVHADGTIEGFVGGACAESSVRLHSLRVLETGEPLLLALVPGREDGEECSDPGEGSIVEHNPCLSGGSLEIFLEPQLPAPRLVVVGRGAPVAQALARLAREAGYDVVDVAATEVQISDGTAAVIVASHGAGEEQVLSAALTSGVPYVALVASPVRGEAVRAALDVPDELSVQLHTPAGLDIGAITPAEIAISILAELVADRHSNPVHGASSSRRPAADSPAPVHPASGVDPVCGMQVAVVQATPYLDVAGERVFFCSDRCRDEYAEQRDRFSHNPRGDSR